MDQIKLIKAREYYDLTKEGMAKKDAALATFGNKKFEVIEDSAEYLAIISASSQLEKEELKKEVEAMKRKQLKSYSSLLDKGEELMNEAKNIQEKIAAQANQRANLGSGVLDAAIDWAGENRNQNDLGDILEGVIV